MMPELQSCRPEIISTVRGFYFCYKFRAGPDPLGAIA